MPNTTASPAAKNPETYQVWITELIEQEQFLRISNVRPDFAAEEIEDGLIDGTFIIDDRCLIGDGAVAANITDGYVEREDSHSILSVSVFLEGMEVAGEN